MECLPQELILSLTTSISCRDRQIRQLALSFHSTCILPQILVVHGVEATGKTLIVDRILDSIDTPSATVRSKECITTRHLLERVIAGVKSALKERGVETPALEGRCESISAFVVELHRLLAGQGKFILVFDGIDRQREAAPALLPALARLGEIVPNLSVILIVTIPRPHLLHRAGVPHVDFPAYTRAEVLSILSETPLLLDTDSDPPATNEDDSAWLWARFTAAVWDSLGQAVARDIVSFRRVCHRLWKPFTQPIQDGYYGPREFSKLLVKNRALLQSESALIDSIIPIAPTLHPSKTTQPPPTLPYNPTHLLLSAYLASHTPPKTDTTLFTRASHSRRKKRGGGTALPRNSKSTKKSKHRSISRQLLGPQPFVLERLFAIFHAIVPQPYSGGGADLMGQFATLVGLRLVVRAGAGGFGGGDVLEGGGKWRCNVGWEIVRGMAGRWGGDVEGYFV